MAYTDSSEFKIPRHIVAKNGVNIESISANKTLTYSDSQYQRLDAQSTSLECILPAEKDGAWFVINCQGNAIDVKDADGVRVKLLSVGEGGLFACDGSSWKQFI